MPGAKNEIVEFDVRSGQMTTNNAKPEDDIEIEIADDTPEQDRGRKPLPDGDDGTDGKQAVDPDAEAQAYTKGVQKRIGEMTHKYHDQRRKAEAAERERDEAVRMAQAALQRTRMLESQLVHGEAMFSARSVEAEELALQQAQAAQAAAFDAGDAKALSDATAKVAQAAHRLEQAKSWTAQAQQKVKQIPLHQATDDVDSNARQTQQGQQRQTPPEPEPTEMEWGAKNPWFGKNRKMTSYVYGIHEELTLERGLSPVDDADEYYAAIDKEMRERFPDYDWKDAGDEPKGKSDAPAAKPKTAAPVAPVSRTPSGNGKKIVLTKSEVEVARKMGITPQEYARQKLILQGA